MRVNINALRDRRKQAIERQREVLTAQEAEDITEERFTELEGEYKELDGKIARLTTQIQREEELQTREVELAASRRNGEGDETQEERGSTQVGEPRETLREWRNLGEFLKAIYQHVQSQGHNTDPRLFRSRVDSEGRAISGASEQVAADGGFLVQKDMATEILTNVFTMGQILSRVRTINVSGNGLKINAIDETSRADGSRSGGVQGYWVGEADTLTATKPTFRQITLDLKKLACLFYATDEVISDADALSDIAETEFQNELTYKMEDSIVRGNGGAQPLGILNASCLVSQAAEGGQAATTIVYENIIKMWSRLFARSQGNAVWLVNQDTFPQLASLSLAVGTGGAPAYLPAGGLSGSPFGSLMGRPVIPVEYCATLGTAGDIILADLSQYILIRKGGVRADSSIHVRFINDELTFRWIVRVDGQPWWTSALTPAQGTNTQSPFVALAAR